MGLNLDAHSWLHETLGDRLVGWGGLGLLRSKCQCKCVLDTGESPLIKSNKNSYKLYSSK